MLPSDPYSDGGSGVSRWVAVTIGMIVAGVLWTLADSSRPPPGPANFRAEKIFQGTKTIAGQPIEFPHYVIHVGEHDEQLEEWPGEVSDKCWICLGGLDIISGGR